MKGMSKHVYTITELTRAVRLRLESDFPEIWVEGEISNFKAASSGHFYFNLKDEEAVLKAVMFKNANMVLSFVPEEGMKVVSRGRLSVYEKQGQYQLYVDALEPTGKGALYAAFEQLKNKLAKEGLFDASRKRPIPFLPGRIGVVTSPTGAVVRDMINVVRRRYANMEITLIPVKVQGEGAGEEIARAIRTLNEYNRYILADAPEENPVDVIIVGRGGGSIEDLWAFNEEIVARAISSSEIPVISAVGHEVDFTIADFVADLRAATPSVAAELAVPEKTALIDRLEDLESSLDLAVNGLIEGLGERIKNLEESYVLKGPMNLVLQKEQEIDDLVRRLTTDFNQSLELKEALLAKGSEKLNALSPAAVLGRGYSITFRGGKVIKDASGLEKDEVLVTRFAKSEAQSRVI
ncbi:MAG: exodeoxyribonuclease VII large subunit [Candidatus Omnitrophica bacterium]|nr:exodeoxyribonuclease VII large subunit [Candidatus Omnitrophota bacterium]